MLALDLALAVATLICGAWLARDRDNPRWGLTIAIAATCLALHVVLIELPRNVPAAQLLGGFWNWTGKLLGFAGCLLFVPLVDPADRRRWLRLPAWDPLVHLGLAAVAVLAFVVSLAIGDSIPFSADTIAFQLVIPTLDEELLYRGILLSLLVQATRSRAAPIWITAVLFGLAHLTLASIEPLNFFRTFGYGLVFAWLTVRCDGSLVPAAILHSSINVLPYLAQMLL